MIQKEPFRLFLLGVFLMVLSFTRVHTSAAQVGQWHTFTNMKDVQRLTAAGDTIWAATTGGLLSFDIKTKQFDFFTNAEGLSSNELTAIERDKLGRIWLGLSNGNINILDPRSGKIEVIIDYRSFLINSFFAIGDTVYIGLNIGLGEYRIDKNEPKELYRQLGMIFPKEIPVSKTLVHHNVLYVATSEGIAKASLDIPNLKAPQSWVNQNSSNGLPANKITDLAVFADRVVAATTDGIAIETASGWQDISKNLLDRKIFAISVRQTASDTTLFVATAAGVFKMNPSSKWEKLANLSQKVNDLLVHQNILWAGLSGGGMASYDEAQNKWEYHDPDGPKGNVYSSLAFDNRNILWCTSTSAGFFAYDGKRWYDFAGVGPLNRGDYRSVVVDQSGRVWMGTWGHGLILLEGGLENPVLTQFDTTGGFLSGSTPVNAGFVVVNELTLDKDGNLWLSNFGSLSGRAVAVVTPENNWAYFSISNGLRSNEVTRLLVDQLGRVWYGTSNAGVDAIDDGGTPLNPNDDNLALGFVDTGSLFSPKITALAEDQDGTLWIGTPQGLHYVFNKELFNFYGTGSGSLISNDIQVIRVDPANNKWIGTSAGVTVLMADNFTLQHYTTENSPLVSNSITDFAFDPETGNVYIATTNGLSVVRTPYTAPQPDFSLLKGYPNPLFLTENGGTFTITNLVRQSGVNILTEHGELVRSFKAGTIPGSQIIWDGRDKDGNLVPSGIYIYIAYTDNGASSAGKVAVIRR